MGNAVKIDLKDFEELKKQVERAQKSMDDVITYLTKDIAALLLRKVIKRTPVGDYSSLMEGYNDKLGGTLRKGWTIGNVVKNGTKYSVEVINPIEYVSYVEYGHIQSPGRFVPAIGKKLKKAWVPGRFMLTISENEIKNDLENILSKRLERAMKKVFENAK